ncbi:hypothetical protein AFL01nite_02680 [Aeromicrobium flavum]|uniref:Uncharacterized protein n=1 Tax=Aeromicrobium flavum TaxID=416568 RepID=A0A512HR65_9ACTN|nr:hypothetical protein AFL01nite_02680 [Aeromicrobium flavum]
MNNDETYARRLERRVCDFDPPDGPEAPVWAQGDPSRNLPSPPASQVARRRSVTWVRISELPAVVGSPAVRRGIDLQAELARRTRRAPTSAVSKTRSAVTRRSTVEPRPGIRSGVTDGRRSL